MSAVIEVEGKFYEEILELRSVGGLEQGGIQRAAQAQRVIPVAVKIGHQPLDICLDTWLRWQRRDDTRLGWRGRSAMLQSDYDDDVEGDSEELYEDMDTRVAEAVEAMMVSLPRHLDWAIRRRCNIATVWRFPSLDFTNVLGEAEGALETLLRKNVATRVFFD